LKDIGSGRYTAYSRLLYRIQTAVGRQHTAAFFTGYRQRQVDSIQPPSLKDTGSGGYTAYRRLLYRTETAAGREHIAAIFTGYKKQQVKSRKTVIGYRQ
jgi:hypothetical protein